MINYKTTNSKLNKKSLWSLPEHERAILLRVPAKYCYLVSHTACWPPLFNRSLLTLSVLASCVARIPDAIILLVSYGLHAHHYYNESRALDKLVMDLNNAPFPWLNHEPHTSDPPVDLFETSTICEDQIIQVPNTTLQILLASPWQPT
jgi:hypothetical protein